MSSSTTTTSASATETGTTAALPFPAADLYLATRLMGRVILPPTNFEKDYDTASELDPALQNILCIASSDHPSSKSQTEKQYFWLQRKIRTTLHGAVRVGFVLEPEQVPDDAGDGHNHFVSWKVAVVQNERAAHNKRAVGDAFPPPQVRMVAIRVEPRSRVVFSPHQQQQQPNSFDSFANELAALQWVAKHAGVGADMSAEEEYVQGPSVLLAGDDENVYTITPYDYYHKGSCSLFEYCATQPGTQLPEETARRFFQQIVKVCMCAYSFFEFAE